MPQFKKYKLGDLCTNVTSGGTPLRSKNEYYEGGTIPWLKTKEVTNGRIYETENHITELGLLQSSAKLIQPNSIIVAMYGDGETAGRVAINRIPLATNQACCNLTINPAKANNEYIFYYLLNSYEYLVNLKSGSGQQNLSAGIIKNMEIEIPSLPTQTRISAILSSLDDKIELNRRTNATLEAMAQTLFKKYFVDDINPDNLPEGWTKDKIGNHVNTILGGTPSTTNEEFWKDGNIPWINSGKANEFRVVQPSAFITEKALNSSNTKLLRKGTTIIAITGATMGQISRLEIDSCANQSIVGVVENEKMPSEFIYFWLKQNLIEILSHATGGAQQHINKNNINDTVVVVPSAYLISDFRKTVKPIFDKISFNCFENLNLQKVRDSLLPKLMSGEIEVNAAENELVS